LTTNSLSTVCKGPLLATIVGGAEGPALYRIGIPKDSIIKYEESLKADKFLLIVHGTKDEVERARDMLKTIDAEEVEIHST